MKNDVIVEEYRRTIDKMNRDTIVYSKYPNPIAYLFLCALTKPDTMSPYFSYTDRLRLQLFTRKIVEYYS